MFNSNEKTVNHEIPGLTSMYVIWHANSEIVQDIKKQFEENEYYQLELPLPIIPSCNGYICSVFIEVNNELYFLGGGFKKVKDDAVNTPINKITKVRITRSTANCFKKVLYIDDLNLDVFVRTKYSMFSPKPTQYEYEKYADRGLKDILNAGLRKYTITTQYYYVFHCFNNEIDDLRHEIEQNGFFIFPWMFYDYYTQERWKMDMRAFAEATVFITCPGYYYLAKPEFEYEGNNGPINVKITNVEPVSLNENWKDEYVLDRYVYMDPRGKFEFFRRKKQSIFGWY